MVLRRGACAVLFVCLCASALFAQQDRIAGPVDDARVVVLRGSVPPAAQAQFDQGAVEPDFQLGNVTLMLTRSPQQQAAIEQLLADQQDPTSPQYHQWLTPESYAQRFGASEADLQKIEAWLVSQGLTLNYTARGRDFLSFSGTASQVEAAFHTVLHRYWIGAETHFANASEISLPAAIEPMVGAVLGLHDFHPKAPRIARSKYTAADGTNLLVPDDLSTIYDISPLHLWGYNGAGQSIAIVGQSDIDPDDIASFRDAYGLPPITIQMVPSSAYPGFTEDEIEADLDLEWSGAVAPFANLLYVYGDDADYAAYYAIDNNLAPLISESYGLCEYQVATGRLGLYNYRVEAQKGNAMGITWLASSGDSGAAGCDYDATIATQGLAVNLPASVPEVTAVGGTEFNEAGLTSYWSATNGPNGGSALSYIPEIAWNDTAASLALGGTIGASGGGLSSVYQKPSWQAGPGVPADGVRDVPDVAMDASGLHDPYVIFTLGSAIAVGGTSAAAPVFTGILALVNQFLVENQVQSSPGLGNINQKLYSMASAGPAGVFHDVTAGNNIVPCQLKTPNCTTGQFGYNAGPGYDLVTGLGSVDAYNLAIAWSGIPVAATGMTLSANPASVAPNGATVLTATVTAQSGTRTPTGTVTFQLGSGTPGAATLSGAGLTATASLTVFGSQLLGATNAIQANYVGSAIFGPSSASTTLTVGTPNATSAVTVSVNPNPVYQQAPNANGATFSFTVQLQETAGVATTLTGFIFDGTSFGGSIASFFGSTALPAYGTLTGKLNAGNIPVPSTVPIVFTGKDASGAMWSRQVMVQFLPASGN